VDWTSLWHGGYVHPRRVRVLVECLADLLPAEGRVLDVGSGDGWISKLLMERRPGLAIQGIDTLVRERAHIPISHFDGQRLPFDDDAFDVLMFVDVLHHTDDPSTLLRESARVARDAVVIKDHTLSGPLAGETLRFMDRIGNTRHGVALPCNYWPEQRWLSAFDEIGLSVQHWQAKLGLYPWPASLLFDRSLHFVARLTPQDAPAQKPLGSSAGLENQ